MYVVNPQHRDNNPKKSQWTVGPSEEIACFNSSVSNGWKDKQDAWGLHINGSSPQYLGVLIDRSMRSFIAKFVDKLKNGVWHGYPADIQNMNQDIPYSRIVRSWHKNNYISAASMRKIVRGQKCDL